MARGPRTAGVLAASMLALAGLTGCGGGSEDSDEKSVAAEELCEGNLSTDAARAVENTSGTKEFVPYDNSEVGDAAEELTIDQGLGETKNHSVCSIYTPNSGDLAAIRIRFSVDTGDSLGESGHAASFKEYSVGREALASPQKAVLYIECRSSKFMGSENSPVLLRGELLNRDSPKGHAEDLRRANLTVLHSVTLALTKELDCADKAGLSTKPSFR
ncbi:hypothetical protein [Streptomyces sp. NPDC048825]|uniref:hypothetical protein n=1 Tax=Streptomyces sp. NPDC048825 TaxID=3365592 RepID=UPI00371C805A